MQRRKLFQVLFMAILCTVAFVAVAFAADREEPRTQPSRERPALDSQFSLKRSCAGTQKGGSTGFTHKFGKQPTSPSFFKEQASGCYGGCDCTYCVCWYDAGDIGCCFDGCSGCWAFLDDRGDCGAVQ